MRDTYRWKDRVKTVCRWKLVRGNHARCDHQNYTDHDVHHPGTVGHRNDALPGNMYPRDSSHHDNHHDALLGNMHPRDNRHHDNHHDALLDNKHHRGSSHHDNRHDSPPGNAHLRDSHHRGQSYLDSMAHNSHRHRKTHHHLDCMVLVPGNTVADTVSFSGQDRESDTA